MSPRQFEIYTQVWADFITGIDLKNVKLSIRYESSIEDYESASARLLALNEYMYYKDVIRKLLKEKKEK
tara:strand:+ start:808 stop:1014 length:207 start_codon:yes stop_codon:yes gene_type:complete